MCGPLAYMLVEVICHFGKVPECNGAFAAATDLPGKPKRHVQP